MFKYRLLTIASFALIYSPASQSQVCRAPDLLQDAQYRPANLPADLRPGEIWLDAEAIDGDKEWVIGRGNAYLARNNERIMGDVLRFNRQDGTGSAENATLSQAGFAASGARAFFGGEQHPSRLDQANYYFEGVGAHGEAERLVISSDRKLLLAERADISTCDPQNPTWWIDAKEIEYNTENNGGVARSATLKLKGVPVFYTPRYYFNTDGESVRQTGFLKPDVDYSSDDGITTVFPFYLNLAPNYDATISTGYTQKKGAIAKAEFRYLSEHSSGKIERQQLFYRDSDKGTGRITQWNHTYRNQDLFGGSLGDLRFGAEYNEASDKEVISDMFEGLYESDTKHLRQQYDISLDREIFGQDFTIGARERRYDILSNENQSPYYYEPQVYAMADGDLGFEIAGNPIKWQAKTSYTELEHPTKAEGDRLLHDLSLSYRFDKSFGYIHPRVQYRSRHYTLENGDKASFGVPTLSLDTGLNFEKTFENDYRHEFSPRLFLAHTPETDQSDFPTFETQKQNINYNSLFKADRFKGDDRVGDVSKVTFGMENSLYTDDDVERLSVKMAQTYFTDAPSQNIHGKELKNDSQWSTAFMEFSGRINNEVSMDGNLELSGDEYRLERFDTGISYRTDSLAARLGYLYDRTDSNDIERYANLSGTADINANLRVMGRFQYDIENQGSTEHLLGLEYGDCCTVARVGVRQNRDNVNEDFDNRVMIELELKGIGETDSDSDFTDRIFGYRQR